MADEIHDCPSYAGSVDEAGRVISGTWPTIVFRGDDGQQRPIGKIIVNLPDAEE